MFVISNQGGSFKKAESRKFESHPAQKISPCLWLPLKAAKDIGVMCLSVEDVAPLDVGVAGESDPPVSLGVALIAGFSLTVVDVILVVIHLPIHFVVRGMRLFFENKLN